MAQIGSVPLDPLSQGRAWYRRKDYDRALQEFTKAVEDSTDYLLLTALDNRAATFEKLGELKQALKDAKQMIHLKPALSKGYLRCGKVLQLKEESGLALQIYERGLCKVKVGTDDDRKLLQGMFSQLQKKLSPPEPKHYDPLVKLPAELAQMVCSYMDMRDRVVCLCVSKPWKRFLEASHDLWKELDLSKIRRDISNRSLRGHYRRSNYTLQRTKINVRHITSAQVADLTRKCKELQYLECHSGYLGDTLTHALPNAQSLRTLILNRSVQISFSNVLKALHARPELEVADFHFVDANLQRPNGNWPQLNALKNLSLISGPHDSDIGVLNLDLLITNTPNLQKVKLAGWHQPLGTASPDFSKWTKLEVLDLEGFDLWALPHVPPTLRCFNLSRMPRLVSSMDYLDEFANIKLPLLETFECNNTPNLSIQVIMFLIQLSTTSGCLKKLDIGHRWADIRVEDFQPCESITEISLAGLAGKEAQFIAILDMYPNIGRLDVSCTNVTGVLVKHVMTKESGPLELLRINECHKISLDAVEWARSRGTEVEYRMPSALSKKTFRDRVWN